VNSVSNINRKSAFYNLLCLVGWISQLVNDTAEVAKIFLITGIVSVVALTMWRVLKCVHGCLKIQSIWEASLIHKIV